MKVLWIARTCPFPANDGEKLRVFNLLKALAADHELTVVCRVMDDEQQAGLTELRKFCSAVRGVYIPPPRNTMERLRWLLPFVFSRYPVSLCTVFFRGIADVLRQLSLEQRFDIVQVEHSSLTIYLDHVRFEGPSATVLTMHNIDYLRNERVIAYTPSGPAKLYHQVNQLRFKRWELESVARFDVVIAMSELERKALLSERPALRVDVVPNGVDCARMPYAVATRPGRSMVFVASMDSDANHDGAMFFLDEVLPLLRRTHPDVTLSIVGRRPLPELRARHDGHRVIVTGQVDDVLPYYRDAAISIVPLRSGGGTRLKILEAMALGTPVISTTIGAEGLDVIDGEHLLLADTPAALSAAIGRLLDAPTLRAALAERARRLVAVHYDWRLIGARHDAIYRSLAHRAAA